MTYGQCKQKALGHIFSEQIAGVDVALTYNNQADYVARIPELINDAEVYIATGPKKIPAVAKLSDLVSEDCGEAILYTMPSDCFQMRMGGLVHLNNRDSHFATFRVDDYRLIGDKQILVPKRHGEDLLVEYFRYPMRLSDKVTDNTPLDNTEDVHELIPLYVAAFLVMYDSPYMYASLYNNFETRLQRLSGIPTSIERSEIIDVYGYGLGGGY